jgi:hypothetical protein
MNRKDWKFSDTAANPQQRLELDIEDWLFFFGRV